MTCTSQQHNKYLKFIQKNLTVYRYSFRTYGTPTPWLLFQDGRTKK